MKLAAMKIFNGFLASYLVVIARAFNTYTGIVIEGTPNVQPFREDFSNREWNIELAICCVLISLLSLTLGQALRMKALMNEWLRFHRWAMAIGIAAGLTIIFSEQLGLTHTHWRPYLFDIAVRDMNPVVWFLCLLALAFPIVNWPRKADQHN